MADLAVGGGQVHLSLGARPTASLVLAARCFVFKPPARGMVS
jgi:hypothetical protein